MPLLTFFVWVGLALGWGVRRFHNNSYIFQPNTIWYFVYRKHSVMWHPSCTLSDGKWAKWCLTTMCCLMLLLLCRHVVPGANTIVPRYIQHYDATPVSAAALIVGAGTCYVPGMILWYCAHMLFWHKLIATMQSAVTGQAPLTLERKITSGGKQMKNRRKYTQ